VKGFPYHVVYLTTGEAIRVLAFAHYRPRPGGQWLVKRTGFRRSDPRTVESSRSALESMACLYLKRIVLMGARQRSVSANVLSLRELWARQEARPQRQNAALSDRRQHPGTGPGRSHGV